MDLPQLEAHTLLRFEVVWLSEEVKLTPSFLQLPLERGQPGGQAARQPGSQAARRPGGQAARQPGSQAARQPGSQAARQPSSRTTRLPNSRAAVQESCHVFEVAL